MSEATKQQVGSGLSRIAAESAVCGLGMNLYMTAELWLENSADTTYVYSVYLSKKYCASRAHSAAAFVSGVKWAIDRR